MQILTKGTNLDSFFESVAGGSERLLILDYDGTLAPFRIERAEALPYPGIAPLVGSIMKSARSRVVIVSGRTIDDLKGLLRFEPLPELYGSHGWERMNADGTTVSLSVSAEKLRGLREAMEFLDKKGLASHAESKHGSIAFHWRGRDRKEISALHDRLHRGWSRLSERYGLRLLSFDGGLELRAPDNDKGTTIRRLLDQSSPGTAVAYLGDDITDEDAFVELEGKGLCVLVNAEPRPTAADIWIEPPDELIEFLQRWADACRR
jgi:trehalose 6-phosphate phosphatase